MSPAQTIADIRAFNRFYTRFIGALDRRHLGSNFSLAEVRVLYELANQPNPLASRIGAQLGLDPGYLSRMLKRFEAAGHLVRERSTSDARATALALTPAGRTLFGELDRKAAATVGEAVAGLSDAQRDRLAAAMGAIRQLLGERPPTLPSTVRLRDPLPGDYGWCIERHGTLYAVEYGWDERFEGLVADLFGRFARAHDPRRERCWIAELDGERVGCVFVVENEPEVAQLRCLLVDPRARGKGVGGALVDACIGFARGAGYARMMLWTNSVLESARRIYEAAGFRLVEQQEHADFGPRLIGQSWERDL